MSTFPRRVCVIAVACLFSLAGTQAANALILDWDAVSWTPGTVNNSYDLNGDSINDVTVKMAAQNNTFTNDPTTGTMTPAINQTLTGGLSPVQNSLMLAGNLYTHSDLTVQLSFTGTQPGAANVSFTIFDIDVTTNSDIISGIYGVAPDGTHVAATITNVGSAVSFTGTGLNQVLTGNTASANSGPGSSNGNATISFGSTVITDIFFTFSNNAGAPFYQDIALGDVSFTPVPEINPAATSAISCLLALGLTTLVHRRAKIKARRLVGVQS
jgi:hypothetical protein